MKVKIVNPENAIGLVDPTTRRTPFIDPETKATIAIADVPESSFWIRRVMSGEVVLVADDLVRVADAAPPTGREPVTPLTTR